MQGFGVEEQAIHVEDDRLKRVWNHIGTLLTRDDRENDRLSAWVQPRRIGAI